MSSTHFCSSLALLSSLFSGVEVWTSDLAFPNNEHHLPISSFGTEQGMTQKTQMSASSISLTVMSAFGFGKHHHHHHHHHNHHSVPSSGPPPRPSSFPSSSSISHPTFPSLGSVLSPAVASFSPYPAMAGMVTSGMKSPEEGGPNGGEGRKETSGNHRRRDSKEGWTGRAQIPEGEVGGAAAGSSGDRGGGGKKGGSNTASAIYNDGSRPSISHPAASVTTQLSSFHPSHNQHLAGATLNMSLLDVRNNEGMPDGFSATQVRAAFLRFFVSLLRNYAVYLNTGTG